MSIHRSSSLGVLDPFWPLHEPRSLTNAAFQSFLHENKKHLDHQSGLIVYRDAQFSDESTVALEDIHLCCCCCSAGPLWSWGQHQTLPITKNLRHCGHTTRKESQSNTTWRINSWAKRSVDRQLCTCCNITNVPNPQSFFLSSKGINKGQVRATRSTEQNTLLTDGEIQPSTPESDMDTAQVSSMFVF